MKTMKMSDLNKGILCILVGCCFVLAAVLTESAVDGLLWGLAGGALGPGIGWIIRHFYWSAPEKQERYREIKEQEDISLHDELNEKLRDKTGRIAYNIIFFLICISVVTFSILGKAGIGIDHKVIVWYLFGLLIIQIALDKVVYYQLRKKY
jgi:hypothetical protein